MEPWASGRVYDCGGNARALLRGLNLDNWDQGSGCGNLAVSLFGPLLRLRCCGRAAEEGPPWGGRVLLSFLCVREKVSLGKEGGSNSTEDRELSTNLWE